MNMMNNGRPDDGEISLVDGDMRDFVRKELVPARIVRAEEGEAAETDRVNFMVDRAGRASVKEIERLIADLQRVRDYLLAEGERVQRSISKYFEASQSTMSSVKVIADSMTQWKGIDAIRGEPN